MFCVFEMVSQSFPLDPYIVLQLLVLVHAAFPMGMR